MRFFIGCTGSGRVIPLDQPAFDSLTKWAGRLVESRAEDYVFPACEAAGIEREHPDLERIDPSSLHYSQKVNAEEFVRDSEM